MAPTKNTGEEEKGHSAIKDVVTKEYANISKRAHGRKGFQEACPRGTERVWKFAVKEMGTPDVHTDTRGDTAVRA